MSSAISQRKKYHMILLIYEPKKKNQTNAQIQSRDRPINTEKTVMSAKEKGGGRNGQSGRRVVGETGF